MQPADKVRLQQMLDAAREVGTFASGRTRADLDRDRMFLLAVVKCIEIVGEAASKISDETRRAVPGIPWAKIVAMRNRLIHGYSDVDTETVWNTLTNNVPDLIAALEQVLSAFRPATRESDDQGDAIA